MPKTLVYKFGGASVKDAPAVKNIAEILRNRLRKNMLLVVSAMGKTTNSLEKLLELKLKGKDFSENSSIIKDYHLGVCSELFDNGHVIFAHLENLFIQLGKELERELTEKNYDEFYDRIIGYGELLSSRIVSEYLCDQGLIVIWQDAREIVATDSSFRFAKVNWEGTKRNCRVQLQPKLDQYPVLTQGFIGADAKGKMTTLGREGSDFTAAILGNCLKAASVTIWKDVPGVLNADPKLFEDTQLFSELDYSEAAQMTYYGASVIHPKTIKPLANLNIPLYVRSFLDPDSDGTKIYGGAKPNNLPVIVLKKNQVLVSFRVTDFTFVEEKHIEQIFEQLNFLKLKVNMLQTSAISVSIVIDSELFKLENLLKNLHPYFDVRYNEGLELLTILHPERKLVDSQLADFEVLLEQGTRNTFQVVRRPM
ncbi:aspartate kinase [Algoriphagus sp. CAU 1675]|uniref:aspartate kinase n=1 Tax=Algoriphagus sp. CAU 1675 TaxID=3032597 RepID=UPI0023DA4208|nr:aspartate kinase [Algoriphagus sp. CAU 1675]MDF2156919.1 aspartate kinase [Algoriphagus sp. CAU 1675]